MKRTASAVLLAAVVAIGVAAAPAAGQGPSTSTISAKRIDDAIAGGWIGQAAGFAWGWPVEFHFNGRIVPRKELGPYRRARTERFTFGGGRSLKGAADDLYMEFPFMQPLDQFGMQADWAQIGQPLAATNFKLWFANLQARENLRRGILPPESGAPANNPHSEDIDFQIEADFIGMAAPGQPGTAAEIAWRLGHVTNYGDGVYGGVMSSAMHAAAFNAQSIGQIVAAGQAAVPAGTEYRRMIDDVLGWYRQNPRNWRAAWRLLTNTWGTPDHAHPEEGRGFNIDATLNGGYVLLGLLYGRGDLERTIEITIRSGQDSDSNANVSGSIVGQWRGRKRLPRKFRHTAMNRKISGSDYTLGRAIAVNRQLAAEVTALRGGSVGRLWQIPADLLQPPAFEQLVRGDAPPAINTVEAVPNGRTVQFKVDAGAGIRDTWWSFGDLSGAHGQEVSHTYLQPGNYRVNLWVASAAGTTTHRELSVAVP